MSQRQPVAQSSASTASAAAKKAAPKVFNPYAKKKSTSTASAVAPSPAPHAAANIREKATPTNGTVTSNPYNKPKRAREQTQQPPQKFSPPRNASSFSQAFGDPDADFEDEERVQQRAFDQSSEPITADRSTGPNNDSTNTNGITPRDHHTMLQPHILHVSTKQRGNPILSHIRNVPFKYSTMTPDYIMATTRCALYLSLRYHNLHPNYVHRRIAELKSDFEYRMLLVYVDIEDNTSPLLFLNDLCVQNSLTLILAWSEEEAARYLETVRAFDGKDDAMLRKREHTAHIDQVVEALKKCVNQTDSKHLLAQFGCWKNLVGASADELSVCPGVGPIKVRRLYEAFHRPFSSMEMKKRRKEKKEKEDREGKEKKASSA